MNPLPDDMFALLNTYLTLVPHEDNSLNCLLKESIRVTYLNCLLQVVAEYHQEVQKTDWSCPLLSSTASLPSSKTLESHCQTEAEAMAMHIQWY